MKNVRDIMKQVLLCCVFSSAAACVSCTADVIGGTVNSTGPLDMTTFEWLSGQEETAIVAALFEKAGLKDAVNGEVTVLAPSKYAVNRYVRRRNSTNYIELSAPRFTIDDIEDSELARMGMYIFPGRWWRETIPEKGIQLTSLDGTQEVLITLDATNTDPGAAYDGGNTAGYGFQYSNFLQSTPYLIHALFKRGDYWELDYLSRANLGLDNEECDQYYRMYVSDVRTSNGVVHVLYSGDTSFNEHYYYHTLFFFGTRQDDR